MDMVTSPPIPATDSRPSQTRVIVLWIAVLAAIAAVVAMFLAPLSPEVAEPAAVPSEPPLTVASAGETCLRLSENPREYLSSEAMRRRQELRRASCDMAFAAEPDNLQFKVAVARAMPHAQRAESLDLLREAAAQGSAEANYELYESHESWDRGDLDKPPMVPRAEAERALRKAADLGHPFSIRMLAILLDRGTTVKRDPVAARYWVERALANPAQNDKGGLQLFLGRLLATSDKAEERARGLGILERLSVPEVYVFGARRELARAIRKDEPVRARKLLEDALRPDPGGATPLLAEMLIAGEGGPADPQRALKLLRAPRDSVGVKGVLGQVYLEGKLVPRDVQEAVNLIDMAAVWNLDARLQVLQLLAANPEVRVTHPKSTLYYAAEAADLDEPGAMTALIELKLSANPQFQDRPGACKLIETAVSRGDPSMAPRLSECRAN
jgi:TPR repeat protein